MSVPHLPDAHGAAVDVEDGVVTDWVGLARYLAEAVDTGDATGESARQALVDAAFDVGDRIALQRASDRAATEFGVESPIVDLMQWALRATTAAAA